MGRERGLKRLSWMVFVMAAALGGLGIGGVITALLRYGWNPTPALFGPMMILALSGFLLMLSWVVKGFAIRD